MGFLDKFWKKKNKIIDTQTIDQELQIPENWDFYMCQIEEQPASYFLNLGLSEIAPISNKPNLLWVELKMNLSKENGLSSSEEFDHLVAIEDQLIPVLTANFPIIYAGRLTHNHVRDFYFYSPDHVKIEPVMQQIMQSFPNYQYCTGQKPDPDWSTYFDCMYPNEEIMQSISNRHVLDNLRSHGDSLEIARPVDHWIYFQNEIDQANFINAIKSLNFTIRQQDKVEENSTYCYQLQIYKISDVYPEVIDECVLQLWRLAKQFNAEYDGWETQVIQN